jgi:competence protein ComEA
MVIAMSTRKTIPGHSSTPWLLKRADQAAVAGLSLAAMLALAGYWFAEGRARGRLIEIDRAVPADARYIVDVNRADWPELAQLPGIGEGLARRIVESRDQDGDFIDHEDLRRVRGIGPKTLEQIRPYLRPMPTRESIAVR